MPGSRAPLWWVGRRALFALVTAAAIALLTPSPASADLGEVTLAPGSGGAGTVVTIAGGSCRRRGPDPVQVKVAAATLGVDMTIAVDPNGSWTGTFTVPSGRVTGAHTVSVICVRDTTTEAYAPLTFTVEAAPPTSTSEPPTTDPPPATTVPRPSTVPPPSSTPEATGTPANGTNSLPPSTTAAPFAAAPTVASATGPTAAAAPSTRATRDEGTTTSNALGARPADTSVGLASGDDDVTNGANGAAADGSRPSRAGALPWIVVAGLACGAPAVAAWTLLRRRLPIPVVPQTTTGAAAGLAVAAPDDTSGDVPAAPVTNASAPSSALDRAGARAGLVPVDIGAALHGLRPHIRAIAGPAAAVQLEVDPQPCVTRLCPEDLDLLVLPLVDNAAQAVAAGGTIRIATGRGRYVPAGEAIGDRESALIVVADTGCGVAAETLTRLREAFAAGSDADHPASALVLVHRIVRDLGGHIDVSSVAGIGTTVTIALPLDDARAVIGPRE